MKNILFYVIISVLAVGGVFVAWHFDVDSPTQEEMHKATLHHP